MNFRPKVEAGQAFQLVVRACASQALANLDGARQDRDPEYLHQLRVGLRRLRAALLAFRPLLKRNPAARMDHRLRKAMRALGPVRDWDVLLGSMRRPSPAALARRNGAFRDAGKTLRRLDEIVEDVLAWIEASPWRKRADPRSPLMTLAGVSLVRLDHALRNAARDIDWRDPAARHRARLRVKRLRYACEYFQPVTGKAAASRIASLRGLQQVLGDLNDREVQRELLREIGEVPPRRGRAALIARLECAWRTYAALPSPAATARGQE